MKMNRPKAKPLNRHLAELWLNRQGEFDEAEQVTNYVCGPNELDWYYLNQLVDDAADEGLFNDLRPLLWLDRDREGAVRGWHVTVELPCLNGTGEKFRLAGTWAPFETLYDDAVGDSTAQAIQVLESVTAEVNDVMWRTYKALA